MGTHQVNINELNSLYEKKVAEHQQAQKEISKLEAQREYNIQDFMRKYAQLDSKLISIYGLELSKDLKDYTTEELSSLSERINESMADVYSKVKNYLTTGRVEDLDNLLSVITDSETPLTTDDPLVEVNDIKYTEPQDQTSSLTEDPVDVLSRLRG